VNTPIAAVGFPHRLNCRIGRIEVPRMVENINRSPKIKRVSWGRIEIEGVSGHFRDAKLFPGGAREWDWKETGTRHRPGIQPADVAELVESGARVVVLSRGVYRQLKVSPETTAYLKSCGVTVHQVRTGKAVRLYNELAAGEAVGGLFHTTC
jgi:hypothetical protein